MDEKIMCMSHKDFWKGKYVHSCDCSQPPSVPKDMHLEIAPQHPKQVEKRHKKRTDNFIWAFTLLSHSIPNIFLLFLPSYLIIIYQSKWKIQIKWCV